MDITDWTLTVSTATLKQWSGGFGVSNKAIHLLWQRLDPLDVKLVDDKGIVWSGAVLIGSGPASQHHPRVPFTGVDTLKRDGQLFTKPIPLQPLADKE